MSYAVPLCEEWRVAPLGLLYLSHLVAGRAELIEMGKPIGPRYNTRRMQCGSEIKEDRFRLIEIDQLRSLLSPALCQALSQKTGSNRQWKPLNT